LVAACAGRKRAVAAHIGIISAERQVRQNGRIAAAQLGFDDSV
jgi:hypothetical protein